MMLEVDSLDTVGRAYDRALAANEPMAMSLGRHANDDDLVLCPHPSGFEIEFGSGGRLMDMQAGEPAGQYSETSLWGHRPRRAFGSRHARAYLSRLGVVLPS